MAASSENIRPAPPPPAHRARISSEGWLRSAAKHQTLVDSRYSCEAGTSDTVGEVEKVADAFPTDGFWMDAQDTLYLSNIKESAVYRMPKNGKLEKAAER